MILFLGVHIRILPLAQIAKLSKSWQGLLMGNCFLPEKQHRVIISLPFMARIYREYARRKKYGLYNALASIGIAYEKDNKIIFAGFHRSHNLPKRMRASANTCYS